MTKKLCCECGDCCFTRTHAKRGQPEQEKVHGGPVCRHFWGFWYCKRRRIYRSNERKGNKQSYPKQEQTIYWKQNSNILGPIHVESGLPKQGMAQGQLPLDAGVEPGLWPAPGSLPEARGENIGACLFVPYFVWFDRQKLSPDDLFPDCTFSPLNSFPIDTFLSVKEPTLGCTFLNFVQNRA